MFVSENCPAYLLSPTVFQNSDLKVSKELNFLPSKTLAISAGTFPAFA
jgi:hypothetical protein